MRVCRTAYGGRFCKGIKDTAEQFLQPLVGFLCAVFGIEKTFDAAENGKCEEKSSTSRRQETEAVIQVCEKSIIWQSH